MRPGLGPGARSLCGPEDGALDLLGRRRRIGWDLYGLLGIGRTDKPAMHRELDRAERLLARGESVENVLEALSRGLTQKMLHGALAELNAADASQREQVAQAVTRMFLRQSTRTPFAPDSDEGTGAEDTALRVSAEPPVRSQLTAGMPRDPMIAICRA